MNQSERKNFEKLVRQIFAGYRKDAPSETGMGVWWQMLMAFSLTDVAEALKLHMTHSKFPPEVADIFRELREKDGRPGPEEAWTRGKIATDQWNSVVLTNEIDDAALAAQDEMTAGNEIAARQIFKEVYIRLVAEARAKGKPVNWFLSEGWDKQKRVPAIREAVQRGLISLKQASRKLPHDAQYALPPAMSKVVKLIGDGKRMNVSDEERSNALTALKKEIAAQRKRGC